MGGLSLNPLRSRDVKSKLPVYENLNSKERDSNDWTDESDYEEGYSHRQFEGHFDFDLPALLPNAHNGETNFSLPRRPGRTMGYRLPNKVVRYMCFGLVSTILLFMFSLIRASQNDNRRLTSGLISKRPPPPPDEPPIDKLAFVNFTYSDPNAEESQGKGPDLASRDLPSSKEFEKHPKSIFNMKPEEINECFLDKEKKMRVPAIRYLDGRPNGFPEAVLGSYDLLNFSEDICYERYGRYSPYGMGYSQRTGGLGVGENGEKEGMDMTWEKTPKVDWRNVDWADAQKRCYQANAPRYSPVPKRISRPHGFHIMDGVTELPDIAAKVNSTLATRDASPELASAEDKPTLDKPAGDAKKKENASNKISRTAVVVRCWDEYNWREEDIMYMRSLITEVSLASGGRYDVHLLVQVKNEAKYPVWADAATYEQRIKDAIPQEFQGLATLWSETQMLSLYQGIHDLFTRGPDLPVHGVYRGLSMALQYFADQHPEYDYFWQWEMDIRYTGHYYDFFTKVENWSKEQPRKGLWERNGRYYVPSVHGTWEDFKQMARVQAEMGTTDPNNMWEGVLGNKKGKGKQPAQQNSLVWGPLRSNDPEDWFEPDNDPQPPTSMERDKYVWGVGEEADYITFNPLFDPEGTTWLLADDITGYKERPPRRAQIITASRLSRKLLMTMHRETAFKKHFAFPEMWPGTVALQHGYKGVFVPHPLYVDREWPTAVLASTLNNGKNSATGGARTSVFGQREHNLRGITWFYDSGFAPNLYRRWLGLKVNNDGGEEFELTEDKSKNGATDVELPVEAVVVEGTEFPESNPNA
ncbi:hypothetical protein PG997_005069 [Apiospora hydei]|uniref:Uncharacterized protein n=1 Tax=Apiospora hydei TaxID=1337664 RepID=A0ABR1X3X2_9PEZI